MLELNEEMEWKISAQVTFEGKTKIKYMQGEAKRLKEKLKEFTDPNQRIEAMLLLDCLQTGSRVILSNGEIWLFTDKNPKGKIGPNWIIKENPKLYEVIPELLVF